MEEFIVNKIVSYFSSALKTQSKKFKGQKIYIWIKYLNEETPIVYLDVEGNDLVEVDVMSLFNVFDSAEIKVFEMTAGFSLNQKIVEILTQIAERNKIDYKDVSICIFDNKTSLLVSIYDKNNKEISCSLLKTELLK